ncbi:MAG: hypothetical protein LUF26_06940 [Firmicutes bacterium]|nr:hypothetical protein [Bacillota bacterium]
MKLSLDFNEYSGTTRLKAWWRAVKSHFEQVQEAHNSLADAVDDEASARETADTALQESVTSEAYLRQKADAEIQSSLSGESETRAAADTALQANIDAESESRETADTEMSAEIAALKERVSSSGGAETIPVTALSVASVTSLVVLADVTVTLTSGNTYYLSSNDEVWAATGEGNDTIKDEDGNEWSTYNSDGTSVQSIAGGTSYVIKLTSDGKALILASGDSPVCLQSDGVTYINEDCIDNMASIADLEEEISSRGTAEAAIRSSITSETSARKLEGYYPEYHSDEDTGDFYLDCANVDNAGTALFKASARSVRTWCDLKSGKGFTIADANIEDDGIASTTGALTTTLTSYAGFNTSTSFTILFCAKIKQQSSNDDSTVLFQLGSNRVLQIHQKGQDGIRLVTYDESSTSHVYPTKLTEGDYTTGHYVIPLASQGGSSNYGKYHHFAVVFDTSAETVTWYEDGYEYTSDAMEDTYVKVDGGYTATLLENIGTGLRYFKIVRSAMTADEVKAYMTAHPHANYTSQPKTQYDNKLLELEKRIAALESA